MITKKWATKIVNIMIPGAEVLKLGCCDIIYIVKMHFSLKNLYSQAWIRLTD